MEVLAIMRARYVTDPAVWEDDDLPHLIAVVAAYVRRRVGDEAADDIVGAVFVKAVAAANREATVPRELEPWLLTIARHTVIDHYRAREVERRALERPELAQVEIVPAPAIDDDPVLSRALARLESRDRELLLLVGWEQLSHREIAQVLSCSRTNVAVRLHRARARLRDLLDDEQTTRETPQLGRKADRPTGPTRRDPRDHQTRRLPSTDGPRSAR